MLEPEIKSRPETLDELFGLTDSPQVDNISGLPVREVVVDLNLDDTHDFPNHPYRVKEDAITLSIAEDIQQNGEVDVPGLARPLLGGGYQVVAGHRRKLASQIAGKTTMRFIVREMSDDEATIKMVSSNTQREDVLPSEKAKAYKMRMDAEARQGSRNDLTSSPVGTKSAAAKIGKDSGDSRTQVYRYITLNNLIPELMEMVDTEKIAFRPAIEIAGLSEDAQRDLLKTMEIEECTPSLSQAQKLKELFKAGQLDEDSIFDMLSQPKPNQVEKFKLPQERIAKYFPKSFTPKQMENKIIELLERWVKQREQQQGR